MDTKKLQRELEHLDVLLAIKGKRDEQDEEDALALALLAVLAMYFEDGDYESFRLAFLNELRLSFESLDPDGIYGDLIDKELAVQSGYLSNFTKDLRNGTLSEAQAKNRARMYAGSLGSLRERIRLDEMGDTILTWRWDSTIEAERHCASCRDLNGVSKKASTWARLDLHPRSLQLDCGFNCHCDLS